MASEFGRTPPSTRSILAEDERETCGVNKFRIKEGKIIEERVYMDTAPLRAARTGSVLEPLVRL